MSISCCSRACWADPVSHSVIRSSTRGAVLPEGGEGAQQGFAERRGDRADAQGADQARLGLRRDLLRVPGGGHQRAALRGERPAGLGERDLTSAAVEKPDAQASFELKDRLAQGRLRHGELLGGPAEVEGLRDGQEIAGLPYLDHQSLHTLPVVPRIKERGNQTFSIWIGLV